ncbi:MAG: DMT family transporter [Cohaesibacter sp.]|jgi:drug/metabolite transporter (DMT)-like permease|nr:DMT family transporter [Cohaesibacter sp.]
MRDTASQTIASPIAAEKRFGVMSGSDLALYVLMVMIWGTSWIAMTFQIEIVPPLITGIYRFTIATIAMMGWAIVSKSPMAFPLKIHLRFILMGIFLFSTNFVLFYYAASYMASGLMAVIFSLASLVNIVLAAIIFGQKPSPLATLGSIMGFAGIGLIFWPEIAQSGGQEGILTGLALGMGGTLCFSIGNMVATANQKLELPLISSTAWGMFYGTLWMVLVSAILDVPVLVEWTWTYWAATIWLAIVASVVAFAGYLTLLKNIGAARASYATVLFPIVALGLSTLFEGYQWTFLGLIGLACILGGNILVMRGKKG